MEPVGCFSIPLRETTLVSPGNSIVTRQLQFTLEHMFRALQLLVSPGGTWVKIAAAKRGVIWTLSVELLPLLLVTCAFEGYILVRWGEKMGQLGRIIHFTSEQAVIIESVQLAISLGMVVGATQLIRWVGESFHFYPRFSTCFTLATFGLSPYFLLRLLHYASGMNEWVGPCLGALVCGYVLYQGVGVVLEPGQTQGFGLYLLSTLIFILLCGMDQMLLLMLVQGKTAV
jgi:hypothetical protein